MIPKSLNFRVWSYYDKKYLPQEINNGELTINSFGNIKYANPKNDNPCLPQDELELELFTGFYDKNKKQIYAGDIVHIKPNDLEDFIDFIDFRKDKGYFLGAWGNDDDWIDDDFCEGCCQVIGNIHENKELIDFIERQDNEWKLFYKRKDEDWLDFLKQEHKDFVAEEEFFNKKYCDLETKLRLKLEQKLKEILSRYL